MLLVIENDIDCRFGDTGLDVLVGDTEAEKLGGEPGGVNRGVFVWDASRICGMPGLGAAMKITRWSNISTGLEIKSGGFLC